MSLPRRHCSNRRCSRRRHRRYRPRTLFRRRHPWLWRIRDFVNFANNSSPSPEPCTSRYQPDATHMTRPPCSVASMHNCHTRAPWSFSAGHPTARATLPFLWCHCPKAAGGVCGAPARMPQACLDSAIRFSTSFLTETKKAISLSMNFNSSSSFEICATTPNRHTKSSSCMKHRPKAT